MKCILVAIDETEDWLDEITDFTGRIYTQYVFNPDEVTHCCEVTPSYYLQPVRYQTEVAVAENAMDDIEAALCESPALYVHCHKIDAMPADQKLEKEFDDLDDALDYWQGNHHDFNFPRQGVTK